MDRHEPPNPAFYPLGRIIAVLELGARAHGEARWIHLYYALGFIPCAGLREPLQKHSQSVLPALERRGTGDQYRQSLDLLATQLQDAAGIHPPINTFAAWASAVLSDKTDTVATGLPTSSTPQDAPAYAQGYLDQRRDLQANRPAAPPHEELPTYYWDYHQGRIMPWNGAGNDPRLSPAFQQGMADQRALTPPRQK